MRFLFSKKGGPALGASGVSSYLASSSAGTLIAALTHPFGGGESYATVGTVPGQLALSSGNIVAGATAAVAGTTYSIKIRCTSADGKREAAETFDLTAVSVVVAPAAPTLSLTSGNTQATLAWTDGSNGGSAITAHKIYRSTTAGFTPGPGNLLTTVSSASPYVDTGLTNGTPYYYAISAVNGPAGEGATSTIQSVTPAVGATLSFDLPITLTKATGQYSAVIRRTGDTSGTTVANWAAAASVLPGRTGALVGPDFGGTWPGGIVTFNPGDVTKTVTFTPAATSNVSPE